MMKSCSHLLEGDRGLHHEDLVETEDNPLEPVYIPVLN